MQPSSLPAAAAAAAAAPQPASMQRDAKQADAAPINLAAHAGSNHLERSDSAVEKLMNELPDDIYALTVKAIASGVKGVRLAHMLLGMLVTVALQLGMLCLLWHIVMNPTAEKMPPDTEKLWTQVGQLQGQLCWMQNALNSSGIDINKKGSKGNCAGAWPFQDGFPLFNQQHCPGAESQKAPWEMAEEIYQPSLAREMASETSKPSWEMARACLLHQVNWYDTLPQERFADENDSIKSRVQLGCKDVIENMGPALAAYGRGLLYPRVDEFKVFAGNGSCVWPATNIADAAAKHPPPPKKRLADGGWTVDGELCTCGFGFTDEGSKVDCSAQPSGVFYKNIEAHGGFASHAQCIAPFKHSWEGADIPNLIVNLLALMAIALFVHDEVRRSASLCHTAAAVSGILPQFYAKDRTLPVYGLPGVHRLNRHTLLRLIMLCAPLWQLVTALLVLLSAGLLSITQETQSSSIQVIINSVALGFVLEIDNKVGQMIAAQHEQWAANHVLGSSVSRLQYSRPESTFRLSKGQRLVSCVGHAYFAVLGLLLCLEPAFLAPHMAITVLVLITKSFGAGGWINLYSDSRISNTFKRLDDTWVTFLGIRSPFYFDVQFTQEVAVLAATPVYAILLVGLVLLVFYKPLPSAARRWPQALLAMQAVTACVAGMYSMFPSMLTMHPPTVIMVLCNWVCMFIIWPTCHKEAAEYSKHRCCCHGNCGDCCTLCCSSGCGPICGMRCGMCCAAC